MVKRIYSVFDQKTKMFHNPLYLITDAEAVRKFEIVVNDKHSDNIVNKFPEDYDLYFLGEFDDSSGLMKPLPSPQHLIKAVQVRKTDVVATAQ